MINYSKHYNKEYFTWQMKVGRFGAKANKFKFIKSVKEEFTILDFGCGGGYLLKELNCKKKLAVEPNPEARKEILKNSIDHIYESVDECLKDNMNKVDLIISHHALEHTLNPLIELKKLKNLLKENGKIHFVVPCEHISYSYKPLKDKNNHLYSWSPMNLGNLFSEAGFNVIYSKALVHKWPPYYRWFAKLGWNFFHYICRIYGLFARDWFQVEILAEKISFKDID